jgi:hypothetical protein
MEVSMGKPSRMQLAATRGEVEGGSVGIIKGTVSKILNSYKTERKTLAKELIRRTSSGSGVIHAHEKSLGSMVSRLDGSTLGL